MPDHCSTLSCCTLSVLHSVLFVQYVFLPTKAETYPNIYVSIHHFTYICPSLFGWKEKTRSSWLNCALRDGEAMYWVSIGHYEAVAVGNR